MASFLPRLLVNINPRGDQEKSFYETYVCRCNIDAILTMLLLVIVVITGAVSDRHAQDVLTHIFQCLAILVIVILFIVT